MRSIKNTLFNNERGLTLVEVLASIVLLSIIIISILMILLQTMKTNKVSEGIIDATYLAQVEMESIYDEERYWLDNEENGYDSPKVNDGWEVYRKNVGEDKNHFIEVSLKPSDINNEMTRVLIQVYDSQDATKPIAQMENLFDWGGD